MYNQQIYLINGRPHIRVYNNPYYRSGPFAYQPVYIQPVLPQNNNYQNQPYTMNQRPKVKASDGFLITIEYQPQKGDAIVIEQAVFRGEVVEQGNKKEQVLSQKQALMVSQGFASQDGENWKSISKIIMTPFKLGQLQIRNITKIKAKFDKSIENHKVVKINCYQDAYYLAFKQSKFDDWFLRLVWAKLMIQRRQCDEFVEWPRSISRKIYKKSQFLGSWQPRYVKISNRVLTSSKDEVGPASLQIKSTKQIWTRFQQIKGGYYVVVKLWYGIIKQQFAVPTSSCLQWLFHFLTLLSVD